ncbi:hypothetical protein ACLOJK_026606 [Asimina triloba]
MSLRPTSRTEVRKKSYKSGVDVEEARRRREDNLVEIRKSKREDNLLKKRREALLQSQQLLEPSQQAPSGVEKKFLGKFIHFLRPSNVFDVYENEDLGVEELLLCVFIALVKEVLQGGFST